MNELFKNWKSKLDELEGFLDLQEDQLEEAFEKQKANLQSGLGTLKSKVEDLGESDQAKSIKAKMEALQVQLALGRAEGKEAFEAQEGKIKEGMNALCNTLKETQDSIGAKLADSGIEMDKLNEKMQANLDVLKMKYALGKADAKDMYEEQSQVLKEKLSELKSKAESFEDTLEGKWEEAEKEFGEAFGNFKNKLGKLFS